VADAHSSSPLEGRVEAMESLIQHLLSNIASVQAALLVAQYVQGTQRSAQTWSIANSAIQGALQITHC
jgi:hypothetical protein